MVAPRRPGHAAARRGRPARRAAARLTSGELGAPVGVWSAKPTMTFSQKSSDSCECARLSAHSRRYEAVFEIEPSTNSIVWIT